MYQIRNINMHNRIGKREFINDKITEEILLYICISIILACIIGAMIYPVRKK